MYTREGFRGSATTSRILEVTVMGSPDLLVDFAARRAAVARAVLGYIRLCGWNIEAVYVLRLEEMPGIR